MSLKNSLILSICIAAASVLILGCKTTGSSSPSSENESASTTTPGTILPLVKEEEQSLYLKMLGVELNSGILVAKDHLHTTNGILECRRNGIIQSCFIKTFIGEGMLSGNQETDKEFSEKTWNWINRIRPEIAAQTLISAEIRCDYIGKKSPPYTIEDVHCKIENPQPPEEALFTGKTAEDIFLALSDERTGESGNKQATFSGSLVCRIIDSSKRYSCLVRALEAGLLSENIKEMNLVTSRIIFKDLSKTLIRAASAEAGPLEFTGLPSSGEVTASVICSASVGKNKQPAIESAICRSKIK